MENKKFDLEDRLVKFACMCLDVCDLLPNTKTGQNLEYQLSKSSNRSGIGLWRGASCRIQSRFYS